MQSELQVSVEQCKHIMNQRLRQVEEKKRALQQRLTELKSCSLENEKQSATLQTKCAALTTLLKEKQDELDTAKENLAYAYKRYSLRTSSKTFVIYGVILGCRMWK